jgi:hypothetical protein
MLNEYSASMLKSHGSSTPAVEMLVTSSAMSAKTSATMPPPTDLLNTEKSSGNAGKSSSIPAVAVRRRIAVTETPALWMVTGRNSKWPPGL